MKDIVLRKPKTLKHKLHAVSPVVATLILIVVAIVGAIAVGLIVSRVASNTSNQAGVQNVASGASEVLTIGGSTTIYPVTSSAVAAFEAEYPGVQVQVAQGGSGAGMEGVIIGSIDMGEASSYPTFSSYSSSAAAQNPPVNLVGINIGGSGVVVITNGLSTADAGMITDTGTATGNPCLGITSAALLKMYEMGTFSITAGSCAAGTPDFSTLTAGDIVAGATYTTVSRSDVPSGTQETFGAWIGFSSTQQDEIGFGQTTPGPTEVGNPGVLSYVESHTNTIGFVDIGFAEQQTQLKAAVGIPALFTSTAAGDTTGPSTLVANPLACSSTVAPTPSTASGVYCYATTGASTSVLDTTIKNALSGAGPEFPDNNAGTNQLSRTFWLVTSGNPTPVEQDFINFLTNPGSSSYFTNQGYYSVYQYKTG